MVTGRPAGVGRLAAALVCLAAVLAAIGWNAWAGPEWGWDRLQYHLYAGFRLTHDVGHLGFAPAGGQSFLNPLAHLPGWLLTSAGLGEFAASSVLAAMHGLCVVVVWRLSRRLFAASPDCADDAGVLAALAAAGAFLTPVYLLEVGTSYADVTTTLPLLLGVSCALRAREGEGAAAGWALAAGVAMGLAAGLKLSNVLAAVCGTLLLLQPGLARMAGRVGGYVAGGVAGLALGHGPWGLGLWRDTGNPFYPMFDAWLAPASLRAAAAAGPVADAAGQATAAVDTTVAAAATATATAPGLADRLAAGWETVAGMLRMSGNRFTPRDLHDWLSFPLRVADPQLPPAGAYIETFQPDPRLLILAAVAIALAAVTLVRRLRRSGLSAASAMSTRTAALGASANANANANANASARGAGTIAAFTAFWIAWYLLWSWSSSNGRYAIGLLMLAAPLTILALRALLPGRRVRAYALLALLVVQATWALVIADPRGFLVRADWSDPELRVEVPPALSRVPVLHLTGWATSWSFLAPALPPGSAFANLDQATGHGVRGLDVPSARRVLEAWQGPMRVLDPVMTMQGERPEVSEGQREALDAWLARWDLAVDPQDCEAIRVNHLPGRPKMNVADDAGNRSTRDADRVLSCAVRPAPDAAELAAERARRQDELFEAIERQCPLQLGVPRGGTRWLGGKAWQRDYPTRGLRLLIAAGKVRVSDELGRGMLLGPVDLLRIGADQIDCTTLTPSRERDTDHAFGTDRGDIDFGGPAPSSQPR